MKKTLFILLIAGIVATQTEAQMKNPKGESQASLLGPFPPLPPKLPIDSIKMGDSKAFPEIKVGLPIAKGPFEPTWASIEKNYPGTPDWLREAKFGIWVHFGPQSAGQSGDWYARNLYKQGSRANVNHLKNFGHPSVVGYKEVLRDWNPVKLDPKALAKIYKDAGARFLLIQGVHHDNFDLWNSRYQPWNSVNLGPKRDFIGEWAKACHAENLRFGVTFHHEYTWWWWQSAFGSDKEGDKKGALYDGNLTLADGKGKWWEGYDPRMLYGIDLREYKGVAKAAASDWSPPPAGIFSNHLAYAKWYTKQWALRMMDVVDQYNPDFIYTDGTSDQPFSGSGTGTGVKADAMQTVIADFYNRSLQRRGKVNTFSIVKFRHHTNGTVNTEEFGIPEKINNTEPWIAEAPVGDWFYAPNFVYDPGMMIRYIIEASARDGNAAICISLLPDGSIDEGSQEMLKAVGVWMRRNGEAIYGSKAWVIPGEGELVNGKLKMLPGGALNRRQAEFKFDTSDFRFTIGKNGALYAFCMTAPRPGTTLRIKSLGGNAKLLESKVKDVSLVGYKGKLKWQQEADGLTVTYPGADDFQTAVALKISF